MRACLGGVIKGSTHRQVVSAIDVEEGVILPEIFSAQQGEKRAQNAHRLDILQIYAKENLEPLLENRMYSICRRMPMVMMMMMMNMCLQLLVGIMEER